MKKFLLVLFFAVFSILTVFLSVSKPAQAANGATSSNLNFQARLLNTSGSVVPDGYYNIRFKIYDGGTDPHKPGSTTGTGQGNTGTAGTALWNEQYYDSNGVTAGNDNRLRVTNGYFSANLGSQSAFSGINWDQENWLTMDIGGTTQTATPTYDGEMYDSITYYRIKLTGVPYAFSAGQLATTSGSHRGTLAFGAVTTDPGITLPDASGTVCLQSSASCGFATGTSGSYIQNGTSVQLTANYAIQSAAAGSIGGLIKGASSQSANLFQLQDSGGVILTAFDSAGKLVFGPSGSQDTNLYRGVANGVRTDDQIQLSNSSTTCTAYATGGAESCIWFGSDTNLYRGANDKLYTDDSLRILGSTLQLSNASSQILFDSETSASNSILVNKNSGDSNNRFSIQASGQLNFGPGNAVQDTVLFRGTGNALRTDDQFQFSNSSTTCTAYATGGAESCLWFGSDSNLYRLTTNSLKTDGSLTLGANLTLGTGAISQTSTTATGDINTFTDTSFAPAAGATGNAVKTTVSQSATNTSGNSIVNAHDAVLTLSTSGATGTKDLNGYNVDAPTLSGCSGGACIINGFKYSVQATSAASTITQNGVNIAAVGVAAGALNGVNISGITASTGTEIAINIGAGWDTVLKVGSNNILDASGILLSAGLSGTYSNTLTLSGASNAITAGTLTATGGTINGTSIGATTPSTGAFSTLSSTGSTTLATGSSTTNTFGSGASSINTIGSSTTPGALPSMAPPVSIILSLKPQLSLQEMFTP